MVLHTRNFKEVISCSEAMQLALFWLIQLVAQSQLDMEGALTARDRVGIQDFVLLDETTEAAFLTNLRKRFCNDLIYVSLFKLYHQHIWVQIAYDHLCVCKVMHK